MLRWVRVGANFFGGITILSLLTSWAIADSNNSDGMIGGPRGWPGIPFHWAPALKQAVGTAYESLGANSPVWFTVADGILTEVFYPSPDSPQVGSLQFLVTDGSGYFSEQKAGTSAGTISNVTYSGEGMSVHISGHDQMGMYSFDQFLITDTASPTVRIHTVFRWQQPGMRVYFLLKPTVGNSASQNLGFATRDALYATEHKTQGPNIFVALMNSTPWASTSVGYSGISDGWQDLYQNFRLTPSPWREVGPGSISLTGEVDARDDMTTVVDLALGFGQSRSEAQTYASTMLRIPFNQTLTNYESGWMTYLQEVQSSPHSNSHSLLDLFVRKSVQIVKMHEDKKQRGAIVASLSTPTHPGRSTDDSAGYHVVFTRDLYHAAMGLLAAGDEKTAIQTLHFFNSTQRPDGSWASKYWINGTALSEETEADLAGLPVLLAGQLQNRGIYSLNNEDYEMIRKATAYILSHGAQASGSVPSAIATEISALKIASVLTHDPGPEMAATQWQASIETWIYHKPKFLQDNYYLSRVQTQRTSPDPSMEEIIDGGFLNLVRLGVRDALDPRIINTVKLYDSPELKVAAPLPGNPERMIYRQAYHPSVPTARFHQEEGYWPLLAGERGHYAVAAQNLEEAQNELHALEQSSTATGLLPEHLIAPYRVRLGVACPLVWAHAEDILLHRSIEEGTVFDAPRTK